MTTVKAVLEHRRDLALARAQRAAALLRGPADDRIDLQVDVESALGDLRCYNEQLDALQDRAAAGPYADGTHTWLADAVFSQLDPSLDSRERLGQVESRAASTSNFAGLVVPQYLVDLAALSVRSNTPLLDAIGVNELDQVGVSAVVPRFTTPMTAAAINGENVSVTSVDPAVTNSTFPTTTIAARATISRQTLERSPQGYDALVAEMVAAVNAEYEREVVAGSGSSGELTGLLNVSSISSTAYTDGTPTALELLAKIAANATAVAGARKIPADLVAGHPRRWLWLGQALTQFTGTTSLGPTLLDMRRLATTSIPTNLGAGTDEDRLILLHSGDVALRATPAQLVVAGTATVAGQLSIEVLVFRVVTLLVRYATGIGVVTGTGLNAVAS